MTKKAAMGNTSHPQAGVSGSSRNTSRISNVNKISPARRVNRGRV